MMQVALYIRVSTEEQAREGVSIAEQKERLKAFCVSQGWSDYEFYIDDGYSAKDTDRPAFKRMIQNVERKTIQVVLTTKIDRLTRRLMDLLNFTDYLDDHDCVYKSSSEAFDTSTAAGRMVLQLLGVFAEFERERIAERVKDNMQHLARQGKPISRPCFGYDLIDKQLVVNEKEALWVKKIAAMFTEGYGTFQIAKMLNENNVLTKNGCQWTAKAVRVFLKNNQMLIGNLVWNKRKRKGKKLISTNQDEWVISENTHPQILDQNTFQAVQEKLEKAKQVAPRSKRSDYLLSGMVRCGHCGSRMIGTFLRSTRRGEMVYYPRYICSHYQKKGLCFNHWIYAMIIEAYVLEKLSEMTKGIPIPIYGFIGTSSYHKRFQEELSQAKRNLKLIAEKSARQLQAFEAGIIELHELKTAKARLKAEQLELDEKIQGLESSIEAALEQEDIQKFIQLKAKELSDALNSGVFEIRQNAVRDLIDEVKVFNSTEIQLAYRI
jgi:site-specific DNA recombinase